MKLKEAIMSEDSTEATRAHIEQVKKFLKDLCQNLELRGINHDASKLKSPEKEIFDEFTPKLKDTKYGSDEYKEFLKQMKPALDHHYAENSHHPEHYVYKEGVKRHGGIDGMNLMDVMELLADWKASTMRTKDGNLLKSLDMNVERFHINDQLRNILMNTIKDMGW